MNELTAPIIRFRHAVEAIGVTKKTLRNWLARGQVRLEEPSEGWATFSRLDLVRLALTSELVGYGMGIVPAFQTACTAVDHATYLLATYRNTPAAIMGHAFEGHRIVITRPEDGKWDILHLRPSETFVTDKYLDAPSLLLINTRAIADAVTDRLAAAVDQDDDEGE